MRGLTLADPALVGAAAGFSPLSLSPALWLDASDAATITSSGGKVSQWVDKSANAYAFTQATSTRQPTTGATTQNSLNVIGFGATWLSDYNAARWKPLSDGTEHIIAIVCKITSNPGGSVGSNMVLGNSQGNTNTRGMWFRKSSSTGMQHVVWNTNGTTYPVDNIAAIGSANATVFTVLADPNNATAADKAALFANAGAAQKNNVKTGTASTLDPNYIFCVGSASYLSTDQAGGFTGWIAELVIVAGTNATEANRQKLRDYLNAKWAVY